MKNKDIKKYNWQKFAYDKTQLLSVQFRKIFIFEGVVLFLTKNFEIAEPS